MSQTQESALQAASSLVLTFVGVFAACTAAHYATIFGGVLTFAAFVLLVLLTRAANGDLD